MKVAVLFSGGKDSTFAAWLSKKEGHEISCLVSIISENKESYMFHTPSISKVEGQAKVMEVPLILKNTKGVKEKELKDLESALRVAIEKYDVGGVVTGAVGSVYQKSRVESICDKLGLKCFSPLWGMDQIEILKGLVKNSFKVIIVGVFAYPLGKDFLGREIDDSFIEETKRLNEKYKIYPAGEGGEFESFVLNCPLFSEGLKIKSYEDIGEEYSWRREVELYE